MSLSLLFVTVSVLLLILALIFFLSKFISGVFAEGGVIEHRDKELRLLVKYSLGEPQLSGGKIFYVIIQTSFWVPTSRYLPSTVAIYDYCEDFRDALKIIERLNAEEQENYLVEINDEN